MVATTSAMGLVAHARARRVAWRTGALFGAAGMAAAFAGGWLSRFVPGEVLLAAFGVLMLATAMTMLRGLRNVDAAAPARPPSFPRAIALGTSVGLASGLLGAGGGFLIVPVLTLFGGLPIHAAVGTSLLVITMQASAGLLGQLGHVAVDWSLAAGVATAAAAGSVAGAKLAAAVKPATLRRAFAWLVIAMGVLLLGHALPASLRVPWPKWRNR